MPMLQIFFEFIVDLIRTLLLEEMSERVRNLKPPRRLHGMAEVRRHVHRATRRRLLNRLSTALTKR